MFRIEGRKVIIEDAQIVPALKNFGGDKFGPSGMRDFMIMVNEDEAAALAELGYNLYFFNTQDEEGNDISIPELKIRVRFDKFPPEVYTVYGGVGGTITQLDETTIGELDNIRFLSCDISFTPYNWERGGKSGTTAYLRTMYVVIPKKDFADKYNMSMI
ncbi:MAG: hypothetical protein J6U54_06260 [Clostridiales bacterium]|nr:hypothetical protein [Clostridiales bacterium]